MGLLDGDLQAIIHEAMSDQIMLDVSLDHFTGGTANPTTGKVTGATKVTYTVKGFRDDSSTEFNGPTREGDMVIVLMQDSRAWSPSKITPAEGDKATVQSISGTVKKINQDPAQATYSMDCKR